MRHHLKAAELNRATRAIHAHLVFEPGHQGVNLLNLADLLFEQVQLVNGADLPGIGHEGSQQRARGLPGFPRGSQEGGDGVLACFARHLLVRQQGLDRFQRQLAHRHCQARRDLQGKVTAQGLHDHHLVSFDKEWKETLAEGAAGKNFGQGLDAVRSLFRGQAAQLRAQPGHQARIGLGGVPVAGNGFQGRPGGVVRTRAAHRLKQEGAHFGKGAADPTKLKDAVLAAEMIFQIDQLHARLTFAARDRPFFLKLGQAGIGCCQVHPQFGQPQAEQDFFFEKVLWTSLIQVPAQLRAADFPRQPFHQLGQEDFSSQVANPAFFGTEQMAQERIHLGRLLEASQDVLGRGER